MAYSFWLYHGPGVDSAPSENKYQEHFLVVKAACVYGWPSYHLHVPTVLKSGSLILLETSRPDQACKRTALPVPYGTASPQLTFSDRGLDIGSISLTSRPIKATSLMGKVKHSRSPALCTDVQFDHTDSCSVPHSLMDEVSQSPHLTGSRWGRLSKLLIFFSFLLSQFVRGKGWGNAQEPAEDIDAHSCCKLQIEDTEIFK